MRRSGEDGAVVSVAGVSFFLSPMGDSHSNQSNFLVVTVRAPLDCS